MTRIRTDTESVKIRPIRVIHVRLISVLACWLRSGGRVRIFNFINSIELISGAALKKSLIGLDEQDLQD